MKRLATKINRAAVQEGEERSSINSENDKLRFQHIHPSPVKKIQNRRFPLK